MSCEHDARFRGVMGCPNGCLACKCEELQGALRQVREWIEPIGEFVRADVEWFTDTLADEQENAKHALEQIDSLLEAKVTP